MTNLFCEFYSPINLENSFGVRHISKWMRSTMQFFPHTEGKGCIEWVVWQNFGNDGQEEFIEDIGLWWDAETMEFDQYDGVFDIPTKAIQLLQANGIIFDPEIWSDELARPVNDTFKLISEI